MASAQGPGGTRRPGPAAGSGKPKLRKGERQRQLVSLSPTFVGFNKSVMSQACYLDLSLGLSGMFSWVFKWGGHMTYCPKWNSRNKREPFDEQASTLGDFHRAVQESGHPPCALHTSRGSRGLPEGGKVESALMLPQSPHGGRPAGKRAHSCIPAATPSSSARTPYSLSVVWMQLQLPAWGRPRPVLPSPAEQPRSLGFSALVFTT